MITLTLTIDAANLAELQAHLATLSLTPQAAAKPAAKPQPDSAADVVLQTVAMPYVEPATAASKANGKSVKEAKETTKAKAEPKVEVEPEPEAAEFEPGLDDVRTALIAYFKTHGEDATHAILKKHGKADQVSKVNKKHYAALYKAATE